MKLHHLLLCLLVIFASAAPARGQTDPTAGFEAERQRINAERTALQAGFVAEDAACYRKFAVNSCLGQINERRRGAMADLRRQEILINDQERKIRGEEQLRKTEEKASEQRQQNAANRRDQALADERSRLERDGEKRDARAARQSREQQNMDARSSRIKKNEEKASERTSRSAAEIAATREFEERQAKAQQRRAEHEMEQRQRVKPPAKSLPISQ